MSLQTIAFSILRILGMLILKLFIITTFMLAWAMIIAGTILQKTGTQINKLIQ